MNKLLLSLVSLLLVATSASAETNDYINHQCGSAVTMSAVERMLQGHREYRRYDRAVNSMSGVGFEGYTSDKTPDIFFMHFVYEQDGQNCWFWAPRESFDRVAAQYVKLKTNLGTSTAPRPGILKATPLSAQPPGDPVPPANVGVAEAYKMKRAAAGEEFERKKAEAKEQFEAKKLEAKQEIEVKREELKERLLKVKDERKKKIVERVSDKIDKLNDRLTAHYAKVLEHLRDFLARIESRTDKAEANGHDVSAVRAAILAAETAIDEAQAAVRAQAGEVYNVTITTEENLRVDVGAARKALHDDLRSVFEKIRAAREAVGRALAALGRIPRVDDIRFGTSTDSGGNTSGTGTPNASTSSN